MRRECEESDFDPHRNPPCPSRPTAGRSVDAKSVTRRIVSTLSRLFQRTNVTGGTPRRGLAIELTVSRARTT